MRKTCRFWLSLVCAFFLNHMNITVIPKPQMESQPTSPDLFMALKRTESTFEEIPVMWACYELLLEYKYPYFSVIFTMHGAMILSHEESLQISFGMHVSMYGS